MTFASGKSTWLYLSPHFDDIALSCGGLLWEQAQQGVEASIWTVCGGSPTPGQPLSDFAQSLHARWNSGPAAASLRQAEDIASCRVLGAGWRHFPVTDCIYRTGTAGQPLYPTEESLWGELSADDQPLIQELGRIFQQEIPSRACLVCPLALGDHVDHQLVRAAAEQAGRRLVYFADYPYVLKPEAQACLEAMRAAGWQAQPYAVSRAGLSAWQAAVAAHQSQISTFWTSLDAMQQAMEDYWQAQGMGVVLFTPPDL